MGYFSEIPVRRIVLPSNAAYWVDIATDFSYGDIKRFAKADPSGKVDTAVAGDLFLLSAIKAWNLDDDTGTVLEITTENIDRLPKDDAIFLINEASGEVEGEDTKKKSSSSP